jgi:hypothetical protein
MASSDIKHQGFFARWITAGTESGSSRDGGNGNKMDYGNRYLGGTPGGGQSDAEGGFFIMGRQPIAYNAMDGGNWLWGQAMKRLGFDYSSAKAGSEGNENFKDSQGDQRAIRTGFHYTVGSTQTKPFVLTNKKY